MARYTNIERIGVNATSTIVTDLGWIFREQPIVDVGIDAHIEIVGDDDPAGKLIAVQIKTGKSYLEDKGTFWEFRGKLVHLDYWTNHSLPVILVCHLPDTKCTYWMHISNDNITRLTAGWKVEIPKTNVFNASAKNHLARIADGTIQERRLRQLTLQKPFMKRIHEGERLFLETGEWLHKSLGRGPLKLFFRDSQGQEEEVSKGFHAYAGYTIEEILQIRFPWACLSIDEEFHESNFCESVYGMFSRAYVLSHIIYPYEVKNGAFANYRLELKLNDFGRQILQVLEYLDTDNVLDFIQ